VTCSHKKRITRMATKVRLMKMMQEIRGLAQITNRRPQTKAPGLFLMQLRSQSGRTGLPKQKILIPIDLQDPPDIPHPVKITYIASPIGATEAA
jgi:hypothetical protein